MSTGLLERPLVGEQRPRFQLAPPAAHYDSGDDAIAFGRRLGIPIDEWQHCGIRNGLGRNADGTWAAFEVCVICQRQNGKGSITDVVELYALFVLGLPVIIHSAHRLDTSRKAFRVIKAIIERNPDLARRCKPISPSDEHIETIGGCRLEFRTRTKSGGRGLTCDLLVLDEALELTAEQVQAIVPTLAAIPGAQIWYTSTVPKLGDQHLCKVRSAAKRGEPRLAYAEWGCDPKSRLDDPAALAQANPAYGKRISYERLVDLRRILGDEAFKTECMGIWPPSADELWQVVSEEEWNAAGDPHSRVEGGRALGISMERDRSATYIGFVGRRADGLRHMGLKERFRGSSEVVASVVELLADEDRPVTAVVIGANDPARSLLPDLRAAGVDVLTPGTQDVAAECGAVFDALAGVGEDVVRDMRHAHQEPLRAAFAGAARKSTSNSWIWDHDVDSESAPLYAVTNASFGFRMCPADDYDVLDSVY